VSTEKPHAALHIAVLAGAGLILSQPAHALTLEFPGASAVLAQTQDPAGSDMIAVGPWQASGMQTRVAEGARDTTSYRIDAGGLSTLQILAPLRDQLRAAGFTILYECEAVACGGFDFRFGLSILPEPDMHVDIGDYRYLSAERTGPTGVEIVGIIVSRSSNAGFVQVSRVGGTLPAAGVTVSTKSTLSPPDPDPAPSPIPAVDTASPPSADPAQVAPDLGTRLESGGAVALDDLVFPPGAHTLDDRDYASLAALAAYLRANPDRTITFVGHTDATGGLAGNIILSRHRAESVRRALMAAHNVPAAQVLAEGVGYLSPRASNLTEQGRAQNRRVEVMLTSTP
jgi:outer membrane protein OmpA-like peptidoglycan-associated protein